MALIDRYILNPNYREHHRTNVQASGDTVLAAAMAYRTENDPFFRRMIAVRELPMRAGRMLVRRSGEALPSFGIDNFTLLERGKSEVVLGLAA